MNYVDSSAIRKARRANADGWRPDLMIGMLYWFTAAFVFLALISLTLLAIYKTPPRYKTSANLLVLLSDDYASRSVVGTGASSFQSSMDQSAYMSAEVAILTSRAVVDETIAAVGPERLYPELSTNPSTASSAWSGITRAIFWSDANDGEAGLHLAMVRRAVRQSLNVDPGRSGNIIDITYENSNRDVAAEFVTKLIDIYFARRSALFSDQQATLLAQRAKAEEEELQKARMALATFRSGTAIADFALQRELLLRQLSDLDRDLHATEVTASETAARHATVIAQFSKLPADSVRRMNEAEVIIRRGEIADNLQREINNLEQALSAASARKAGLTAQMAGLNQALQLLSRQEGELEALTLQLDVRQRQYAQILQTLGERQSLEAVAQARLSNIKLISSPEVPSWPTSQRKLIAASGLLLALFSFGAILAIGWFRRPSGGETASLLNAARDNRDDNYTVRAV